MFIYNNKRISFSIEALDGFKTLDEYSSPSLTRRKGTVNVCCDEHAKRGLLSVLVGKMEVKRG